MTDAREITLSLGGKWYRKYGAAPCPVCQSGREKAQNALTIADGRNGSLVLDCKKSACAFLDILAAAGEPLAAISRQTQKHLPNVKPNSSRKLKSERRRQGQFGARRYQ